MSRELRLFIAALGLVALVLSLSRSDFPEAVAQVPAARTAWEYQTASVELGALGGKLNDWGNDGWELIGVVSTESQLDTQDSDKPRLQCHRVEIVAKRPRTR
jgi:hypothetical protein